MHDTKTNEGSGMNAESVADYLKQHPDFFEQYADVLAEIYVPHPHGGHAIPIAERQIVTLREKNGQLESKLRELIQFGTDNDAVSEKLHRSTLALFSPADLETTPAVPPQPPSAFWRPKIRSILVAAPLLRCHVFGSYPPKTPTPGATITPG